MEARFVVPAVTFMAGFLIWVAYFILFLAVAAVQGLAPWSRVVLCLVVGGLIFYSGVRCHQAGGPRYGSFVRSAVLVVLALLTFWKVGIVAACVLLLAALATGARGLGRSPDTQFSP